MTAKRIEAVLRPASLALIGASDTPGTLGGSTGGKTDTLRWTDLSNQSEATALNIAAGTTQNNRRVFLSRALTRDVRFSGTPRLTSENTRCALSISREITAVRTKQWAVAKT